MRKPKTPPTIDELQKRLAEVHGHNRELIDINEELLALMAKWREVTETLLAAFAAEGSKSAAKFLLSMRIQRARLESKERT
ncbi:hypothetical protein HIV01_003500 [Lysobacter arenosi]|uniref:Uncharacterized protein n=1 Tax=Lysobacter arenosi TaxID=2795387 RepID=A0ABX7RD25_9GAMM|nr:hypothetical protein [Lysobacter arenosi]QSX75610.1 hypothetical protein HIV01_003500 [Lysobacter arenosi]